MHTFQQLISVTSVHSTTILIPNPSRDFQVACQISNESWSTWTESISQAIEIESPTWWTQPFPSKRNSLRGDPWHIFVAVLVGNNDTLPWGDQYLGVTLDYPSNGEQANLILITMRYATLYTGDEGLTRILQHELGHGVGDLPHPL